MPPPVRPGPTAQLGPQFPPEGTEAAFRAILGILRAAPQLARVTIKAWEGSPSDLDPPGDDQAAWVRLTPDPMPSDYFAIEPGSGGPSYAMPFGITVETSTRGTSVYDSMRLWGALWDAIEPKHDADPAGKAAVRARLDAVGVEKITVRKPAWGVPSVVGNPDRRPDVVRTYGVGRLEVTIYFGT